MTIRRPAEQTGPTPGADGPRTRRPAPGGRPGSRPRRPQRSGLWSLLGWSAAGLAAALTAFVTFLLVLAPADIVRDQVIAHVRAKTGREMIVSGATSLRFFPALAVSLGEVSISPPPGMTGEPTLSVERFEARVPIGDLLRRRLTVDSLVLTRPTFRFAIDRAGRRSWDFAHLDLPREPVRTAQVGGAVAGGAVEGGNIALGEVRIVDGTVIFDDQRHGFADSVTGLDVSIRAPDGRGPAEMIGTASVRGERLDLSARVASLDDVLRTRPVQASLTFSSARLKGTYSGTLAPDQGTSAGRLAASGPSLKRAAAWLGAMLPGVAGLGPFEVTGTLATDARGVRLSDAVFTLDGQRATGHVAVTSGGPRPLVRADLTASALDLGLYTPDGSAPVPPSPPVRVTASGAVAPATTIEDLIRRGTDGPQVKGYVRRAGWNEEPFGAEALGTLDLDARVAAGALVWRQIKLGQTRLTATLKDRVLKASLDDMRLYDGRGRGLVTLDAAGATPAVTVQLALEDVRALPLMTDAAGFDWMDGVGRLSVAVTGQGASEKTIVESLQGRIETSVRDGALIGLNVAQMLRGLGQGKLPSGQRVPTEKTEFSEMAASYRVVNGIAQSTDFRLASPLLRATGVGQFNLPARTLDWTVRPKIVGGAAGPSGGIDLSALDVPMRITGGWDDPKVAVDLDSVLKDPGKAVEAARQIGKQLGLSKALEGLLGGDAQKEGAPGGQSQNGSKTDLKGLLNQFLKK